MIRQSVGVWAIWLLISASGFAQDQPPVCPCGQQDVVGTWSLVRLRPNNGPAPERDPDFLPYQVWVFTPGGKFVKMSRATPFKKEDYAAVPTISQDQLLDTTYTVFENKAALMLYPKGAPTPYLFSCFVVVSPHQDERRQVDMRPGDLLLDLRTLDGQHIIVGHHFRKVGTRPGFSE